MLLVFGGQELLDVSRGRASWAAGGVGGCGMWPLRWGIAGAG